MPSDRFDHSLRVAKCAMELAIHYTLDQEKAKIAAILHDCSRYLDREGMVKQAEAFGIKLSEIERFEPKLIHADLSAEIAKREYGVQDPEILKAIAEHTLGSDEMSELSKIVYLADHIESDRDYQGVEKVRGLAFKALDQAIALSTGFMIQHLLDNNLPIALQTVKTRNRYLKGGSK